MTGDRPESEPGVRSVALDQAVLAAQTGGDKTLERQVLELFLTQFPQDMARMAAAGPGEQLDIVHRMLGSARAVGAVRLAGVAADLEAAGSVGQEGLAALQTSFDQTSRFIADYLAS